MEESPAPILPEGAPEPHGDQLPATPVELLLDNYQIAGELRYSGAHRRLVDILNVADNPILAIHNAQLKDLNRPDDQARHFDMIQVERKVILLALPLEDAPPPASPFEMVKKVPVPVTIALPGFIVAGNVHFAPEVDPALAPMLGSGRFIPMTDATVTAANGTVRQERIVVVNLGRALAYALEDRDGEAARPEG